MTSGNTEREKLKALLLAEMGLAELALSSYHNTERGFYPLKTEDGYNPLEVARRNPNKEIPCFVDLGTGQRLTGAISYKPSLQLARHEATNKESSKAEQYASTLAAQDDSKKKKKQIKEAFFGDYFLTVGDLPEPTQIRCKPEGGENYAYAPVHDDGRIPDWQENHAEFYMLNAVVEIELKRKHKTPGGLKARKELLQRMASIGPLTACDMANGIALNEMEYFLSRYFGTVRNIVWGYAKQSGWRNNDQIEKLFSIVLEKLLTITTARKVFNCRKSRNEDELKAYLYGIIGKQSKKLLGKISREARDSAGGSLDTELGDGICLKDTIEARPETVWPSNLLFEEKKMYIQSVVNELTEAQATALCLYFFEGKSQKVIAKEMGKTSQAVKSLVNRAKKSFKRLG